MSDKYTCYTVLVGSGNCMQFNPAVAGMRSLLSEKLLLV